MDISSKVRSPDIFVTITCNPNWSEMHPELAEGYNANFCPDIGSHVFQMKK